MGAKRSGGLPRPRRRRSPSNIWPSSLKSTAESVAANGLVIPTKEALARFYAEYLPGLKPKTQERYRGSLRRFEPYVGHLHLDQITKTVLADYVSARRAQGVTGATIRRDLATLSSVCSFAQAVDMVEINPVKAFSKRPHPRGQAEDQLSHGRPDRSSDHSGAQSNEAADPLPRSDRHANERGDLYGVVAGRSGPPRGAAHEDEDLGASEPCR